MSGRDKYGGGGRKGEGFRRWGREFRCGRAVIRNLGTVIFWGLWAVKFGQASGHVPSHVHALFAGARAHGASVLCTLKMWGLSFGRTENGLALFLVICVSGRQTFGFPFWSLG